MEKYITLNTGAQMPNVGLGTWKSQANEVGAAVKNALEVAGYRHIDCAAIYKNEKEIGEVFKTVFSTGKLKREEVFITSKLWNSEHPKDRVRPAYEKSLEDLQVDYLDLYLVHWGIAIPPNDSNVANQFGRYSEQVGPDGMLITEKVSIRETWEALEELYKAGSVKAIGVSNFTAPMLIDLLSYAKVIPAVNQIEVHPYNAQTRMIEFCRFHNIAVTGYSPLANPTRAKEHNQTILLEEPQVVAIGKNHSKSPAQIVLRWAIQRNTIVIPKSLSPDNLKQNIDIYDFELSTEEMDTLNKLDKKMRVVDPYEWWKIPYFD